jgi:hypothetical protein
MADIPKYLAAFNNKSVSLATGNTDRSGQTGTKYAIVAGAGTGTVVHRIKAVALVTTTAGALRFYIQTSDGLFNVYEIQVAAVDLVSNPAGMPWSADILDVGITLKAGETLYVSTHKSETFHVTVFGQDY